MTGSNTSTASSVLTGTRVILAVSGGIAAYKAVDLCSKLVQAGSIVDVVLTRGALEFLRPLLFNAITQRPVHTSVWEHWSTDGAGHVSLGHEADALVVAPATANTIARLALGVADDALGTIALATRAQVLLAPAMEHNMWHHPLTQEHLANLRQRGVIVVDPEPGRLASGMVGDGRLASPETIVGALRLMLGRNGPLAGRRVVVTAGPTYEPLDPVRYLGNRSSGKMGYVICQQLLDRGASVHLVSGPVALRPPVGTAVTQVQSAAEMLSVTEAITKEADALVMTAAVADFRPAEPRARKIKKNAETDNLVVRLARNPDILGAINHPGLLKIGFAAETDDLIENASIKLRAKGLAMIVANDAVATIGSERSAATLLWPDRQPLSVSERSKEELAVVIGEELVALLRDRLRDASV